MRINDKTLQPVSDIQLVSRPGGEEYFLVRMLCGSVLESARAAAGRVVSEQGRAAAEEVVPRCRRVDASPAGEPGS